MAQATNVTYKAVKHLCDTLKKSGGKISVLQLQSALGGGSSANIAKYLRQWRSEEQEAAFVTKEISEDLRRALMIFVGDEAIRVNSHTLSDLKHSEGLGEELRQLLEGKEAETEKLKLNIEQLQELANQESKALGDELKMCNNRIAVTDDRLREVEHLYNNEVRAHETAKLAAFSAERLVEKLEAHIEKLQGEVQSLREGKQEADVKWALAEGRIIELEKQLTKKH
jgi:hypothetical protein